MDATKLVDDQNTVRSTSTLDGINTGQVDLARSPMVTPPKKKRAPRGTKAANPLAEAKTEVRLLQAKVVMMDDQLKAAFARGRADAEMIDSLHRENSNLQDKLTLTARQIGLVLETIRIGGK